MIKRKVAFKTLGCRLNQFETDSIANDFYKTGYEIVDFGNKADVYVINTCTVTNQSDQKSKNNINQAVRNAGSKGLVVVTGCMVTSRKEYLEGRDDLTYVVDNSRKKSILPLIESHFNGEILHPSDMQQDLFNFSVAEKSFHTRAMIKIQDGCNNHCTFCIVPSVRGKAKSRPLPDIIENVKQVLDYGYKEIVLTGVNISRYRWGKYIFEDVVEKILEVPGDFRVRISSIEPEGFGEKFYRLFAHPKLCPHLHLCLQSGSDKVLMRMRRFYTLTEYRHIIDKLYSLYPDFNFTTDIIVGFPGETEEEFNDTCRVVKEIGFSHIHTFKYSVRKGTRAERLPDQIPEKVKTARSKMIREIADENKLAYRSKFIGKNQRILIERTDSRGFAKGYGEHYIPLKLKTEEVEKNRFYSVQLNKILKKDDFIIQSVLS
jgi:threonylcarbamoyladenosine tRNA methylthiotransferase MtaB